MSRNQKESLLNSVFRAFSTTGGYIVAALILVIVAVVASIFHVNWSERIAAVGLAILFTLILGKREARTTDRDCHNRVIAKIERQKTSGLTAAPRHRSLNTASSVSILEEDK